jgi:hypothetical protein
MRVAQSRDAQAELNEVFPNKPRQLFEHDNRVKAFVNKGMIKRQNERLAVNLMFAAPEQKAHRLRVLKLLFGEDNRLTYVSDRQKAREWMDSIDVTKVLEEHGIKITPRKMGLKALQASLKLSYEVKKSARLTEAAGLEGDLTSAVRRHSFEHQRTVLNYCQEQGIENVSVGHQKFEIISSETGFPYLSYFHYRKNQRVHYYEGQLREDGYATGRNAGINDDMHFLHSILEASSQDVI